MPDQATEGMPEPALPAGPPPKRLTVMEPPIDVAASPATGYALLGRTAKVSLPADKFHASCAACCCMRHRSRLFCLF